VIQWSVLPVLVFFTNTQPNAYPKPAKDNTNSCVKIAPVLVGEEHQQGRLVIFGVYLP